MRNADWNKNIVYIFLLILQQLILGSFGIDQE